MISVYDKDVNALKKILLITIAISILMVSYAFTRFLKNSNQVDNKYSMNIVYNNGRDTCLISNALPVDRKLKEKNYNFSIIGYNNTESDVIYEIVAKPLYSDKGERYLDNDILLELKNNDNESLFGPIEPLGLTEFGIVLKEVTIPKNTKDFVYEYTISLLKKENNYETFADINEEYTYADKDGYYGLIIDIKKNS